MKTLRAVVSGSRVRYTQNGFDLDLTYITPNLIAMGYPASGVEKTYRNDINEVRKPNRPRVGKLAGLTTPLTVNTRSPRFWTRTIRTSIESSTSAKGTLLEPCMHACINAWATSMLNRFCDSAL